ncbi:MAG: hypothetical protein IJJ04_04285 [Clostridia bacterium]|nr:hypothetical protein [Clostridia bacterium]
MKGFIEIFNNKISILEENNKDNENALIVLTKIKNYFNEEQIREIFEKILNIENRDKQSNLKSDIRQCTNQINSVKDLPGLINILNHLLKVTLSDILPNAPDFK